MRAFFKMIVAHGRAAKTINVGLAPLRGLSLDVRLGLRLLVKHIGLTVVGTIAMAFAIWGGIVAFEFYTQIMHPRLPLAGGAQIVGIVMVDTASRGERAPTLHDFGRLWPDHGEEHRARLPALGVLPGGPQAAR